MSIEKLSDYFNSGDSKQSLQRIFMAYQIEQVIQKEWHERVGVVVADKIITIRCQSSAQSTMFTMRKPRLYAVIARFTGKNRYQIKIKVGKLRTNSS